MPNADRIAPLSDIANREALIAALERAAEFEHALCCTYLFAAFSLKRVEADGGDWPLLERNREWAATLLMIAREEMAHLGLTCNLLSAIGAAPRLWHPPFPYDAPIGTAGMHLTLGSLSVEALERFAMLEATEEHAADPAAVGLGALYRTIRAGLERIDEAALFIGAPDAQLAINFPSAVELAPVRDRAGALRAVDRLLSDSGGAAGQSHHQRLLAMRDEFLTARTENPDFAPARPVAANPACGHFRLLAGQTLVTNETTRKAMTLFNDAYLTMLLVLSRLAAPSGETADEMTALRTTAYFPLMTMVIRPLGEMLTTLPIGPEHPGVTAGPGFELPAEAVLPPDKRAAWRRLHDLFRHLTVSVADLARPGALGPRGAFLHENLVRIEANFARSVRG